MVLNDILEIDEAVDDLEELAAEEGAILYNIVFRKSGVALQWFEPDRILTLVGKQPDKRWRIESYCRWKQRLTVAQEEALAIYGYHPTLEAAFKAEFDRLTPIPRMKLI